MNRFQLFFSLLLLAISFRLTAQTEPLVHPSQVGSYGAAAGTIMASNGSGAGATVSLQTATALGLDQSVTNEAQTLSAGGTTSPTIDLTAAGGAGGGTLTLVGAGGLTFSRSANTITATQTAGATYSGTAPIDITGATVSLNNSGVTAGTYNNVTVTAKGLVSGASNVGYLTAEVDGSATNEIQALSRTSTTNTASLSLSGGSVAVDDVKIRESFAPTSGTTVTLTTTPLPTDVGKFIFIRNGIVQNYGASKGVVSVVPGTGVVTVTRTFSSGEVFEIEFPKQ